MIDIKRMRFEHNGKPTYDMWGQDIKHTKVCIYDYFHASCAIIALCDEIDSLKSEISELEKEIHLQKAILEMAELRHKDEIRDYYEEKEKLKDRINELESYIFRMLH